MITLASESLLFFLRDGPEFTMLELIVSGDDNGQRRFSNIAAAQSRTYNLSFSVLVTSEYCTRGAGMGKEGAILPDDAYGISRVFSFAPKPFSSRSLPRIQCSGNSSQ